MNAYALSQSLRILSKWWPEGGLFTMPVAIAAAIVAAILVGIFASLRSGNSKKQGPVPASEEFAPEGAAAHPKTPSKLQSASLHEKTSPVTKSPPSVSTTIPASPTSPASATTSPLKATSLDKGTATTVEAPSPAAMVDFLLNTVKVSKRDLTAAMKYSGDNGERDLKTFLDGRGEQVAARTQDLTTYYVEQASKWARTEVDELLSQHAVSKADISAALGYSGHNGVRDVAAFLEGRATDLHAKREKLRDFAAVARDRSSKATPVKPAAPVTKESSPKTESKATAAKPPSPTEATPKTTTTAASPAKPLASVEKSAATKVDAASAEKVTFLLEVLLRSKSDVTKAIGYSGNSGPRDLDAFLEGKCEDLENRKAKLDAYYDVEATAWAAAEVKRLVEVEGVSAADLSAAIGYSGSHGVRDLAVFTEGRAKDIETRRRKLRDFIQARAKSANPCADGKKPTPAPLTNQEMVDHLTKVKGISLADISEALGYSGKNGQRDVDSFLEGRSKELEERSQKLKVFYDSHA